MIMKKELIGGKLITVLIVGALCFVHNLKIKASA